MARSAVTLALFGLLVSLCHVAALPHAAQVCGCGHLLRAQLSLVAQA